MNFFLFFLFISIFFRVFLLATPDYHYRSKRCSSSCFSLSCSGLFFLLFLLDIIIIIIIIILSAIVVVVIIIAALAIMIRYYPKTKFLLLFLSLLLGIFYSYFLCLPSSSSSQVCSLRKRHLRRIFPTLSHLYIKNSPF